MGMEMVSISSQWLAILLSAVVVWIASALVWMALPHHKKDYKQLPDEDAAINTLRPQNLKPGLYNIPHCKSWDEAKKPEIVEKFNKGPIGFLTVLPNGMPNMAKSMVLSFAFYLVVSVVVAYVVSRTVHPGADYLRVFRIAGVVAWLAYGMSAVQDAIWFGRPWSQIFKFQFDALFYALLTAGVFGWQWVRLTG